MVGVESTVENVVVRVCRLVCLSRGITGEGNIPDHQSLRDVGLYIEHCALGEEDVDEG